MTLNGMKKARMSKISIVRFLLASCSIWTTKRPEIIRANKIRMILRKYAWKSRLGSI